MTILKGFQFLQIVEDNLMMASTRKTSRSNSHHDEPDPKISRKEDPDIFTRNSTCNFHVPRRGASVTAPLSPPPSSMIPTSFSQRLIDHGFQQGVGDHVLGALIVKSPEKVLHGAIIIGAPGIPGLSICKSNQWYENHQLMKMSFATHEFVDHFLRIPGYIPERFLNFGIFNHYGYAIGVCSAMDISKCHEFYQLLNIEENQIDVMFPVGGAAIAPQPKSLEEEDQRRQELMNSLEFIKTFNGLVYHKLSKKGQNLTFKVRLEMEEVEVEDIEIFEKLMCYRVLESNAP
jgi:hypothetical protein